MPPPTHTQSPPISGIPIDDEDIADLGGVLIPMMSMTQLEEAVKYYRLHHATLQSTTISLMKVRRVMANHWRSCLKLPAGGAHAGGSQQTGFDMEMIDPATARVLFRGWPNYQSIRWGHSWECRTMEEIAAVLSFEDALSG